MKQHKATAIVIGGGTYNDLGVIRSCGETGMNVVSITPLKLVMPIYKSKYIYKHISIDINNEDILFGTILKSCKEVAGKVYLYPTTDFSAYVVDKYYDRFGIECIVPNSAGNLKQLMSKDIQTDYAHNARLLTPQTKRFNIEYVDTIDFNVPCIIKPLMSINGEKSDISICRSEDELLNVVRSYKLKKQFQIIVQELIESPYLQEIAVPGVSLQSGEIIIKGIVLKKRIRGNGSTVYAVYEPEIDANLKMSIINFIRSTDYKGIFDIEFLNVGDKYYFIECNFRNGAYGYAITKAGFNLPGIVSGVSEDSKPVKRITFMEERSDILNAIETQISWWQWLKDVMHTDCFLWWNWNDLRPMLRVPATIKRMFKYE